MYEVVLLINKFSHRICSIAIDSISHHSKWLILTMKSSIHDPYAVLRIQSFRLYLLGRLFLTLGFQIQEIAIGWILYAKTGNPLVLGFTGLAVAIPYIITSMFSGLIADTKNRKYVVIYAVLLMLSSSIALLFKLYIDSSIHTNTIDILPYYIVLFFVGLARGFMGPSLQALWADFIPKELFPNGATWSANTFNFGAVAGPALGGVVLGFYGANAAAILTCLLLISSIIAFLRLKYKKVIRDIKKEPLKDKLLAGLRFVFSHQILVGAMALDMFAVMFGGAIALLPAFVKDVLLMGPEALGILRAAPFIGSLLMGIYLAHHPPLRNTGKILLISIAGFGLCIIGFAMSTNYLLSLLLLAASGSFDNVSMVIRGSIAQLFTPDEMRGRVSAVNGVFIGSSNEIGAFESGLAASLMGLIPSVIFGGSITIIIVLCTAIFIPALATFSIRTSMHNNQT